jgi:hypothetical protein
MPPPPPPPPPPFVAAPAKPSIVLSKATRARMDAINATMTSSSAAAGESEPQPPDHLLCPITLSLFADPVTMSDGNT